MKLIYQAYDASGRTVSDAIEAATESDAMTQLRHDGLFVMQLRPASASDQPAATPAAASGNLFNKMRSGRHLSMFTRQLYVLCSTGTPLVEALSALERQTRDEQWRVLIAALRQQVEEGSTLADAMASHTEAFDAVYRSLIAAGESSGRLEVMLDRLATLVQRNEQVRRTVTGSLMYPSLLLTVSVGVFIAMLTLVLPRFAGLFETLNMALPASTEFMLGLSTFVREYWWLVILGFAASAVSLFLYLRTPHGREMRDTLLVRTPYFGAMVRSFATARITRLLGTLLDNHVTLLDALELTRESAGNVHYHRLIERAEETATRGESISNAFRDSALIAPSVYEALRSGENTGQIGPLLINIADFLDEDNEVVLKSLTSILEPVILVALGLLVGLVALSLFLPLFDLTASVGG